MAMKPISLTALRPENPIAWMAACGVLRLLPGARLRWSHGGAELDYTGDPVVALTPLPPQRLLSAELNLPHELKATMPAEAWTDLCALPGDWTLAVAGQVRAGLRVSHLKIAPGPAASSDMIINARKVLAALVAADIPDKLREALIGPWRYEDKKITGWGWDAAARVEAAYVAEVPDNLTKWGVVGAYWLAWEALPLFPVIHGKTLHWDKGLTYATWTPWLDWHDVKALMLGLDSLRTQEAPAPGMTIWTAKFLPTHQGTGRLSWAAPLARTPSDAQNAGGSRSPNLLHTLIV
jgi:hypothetical protein